MAESAAAQGLRERKREQTAGLLEHAALRLFAEHGFEAVSVADVAEEAGVSRATVFRYFRTKQDLLFADHDRQLAKVRELFAAEPEGVDVVAVVGRVAVAMARWFDQDREALAQRLTAQAGSPDLIHLGLRHRSAWEVVLAEEIAKRAGRKKPGLSDWVVATCIVSSINVAVIRWWHGNPSASLVPAFRRALKQMPGPLAV